jgi:hypothetical protein
MNCGRIGRISIKPPAGNDFPVLVRDQVPRVARHPAQMLDGGRHIAGLLDIGLSKRGRPVGAFASIDNAGG